MTTKARPSFRLKGEIFFYRHFPRENKLLSELRALPVLLRKRFDLRHYVPPNVILRRTPKNLLASDEKADASHSLSMTSKSAADRFSFSAGVHST
jgi:hypothetical protein